MNITIKLIWNDYHNNWTAEQHKFEDKPNFVNFLKGGFFAFPR